MAGDQPLRVFVALPGTEESIGGDQTPWNDPDEIKRHFYGPVGERLAALLGREVEIVVGQGGLFTGDAHRSAFQEAWLADVYISDLTGSSASVCLELGVRWAVRDNVTVIVSQNVAGIGFDAGAARAIPYSASPGELQRSVEQVAQAIVSGLSHPERCDSPVREGAHTQVYDRAYVEGLEREIERLRRAQPEMLYAAAMQEDQPQKRMELLQQTVEASPAFMPARLALGRELRKAARYEESVEHLKRAAAADPTNAECHREIGVAYSKLNKLEQAVDALREAVRLAPRDAESLSNLGGALRRWGMRRAPDDYDWDRLREARDAYESASRLLQYDTYSLLNIARLNLLLAKVKAERAAEAVESLRRLRTLCAFRVGEAPDDYWRRFDLADTFLLSGAPARGLELYREALARVPVEHQQSVLTTVAGPLHDLLAADVFNAEAAAGVRAAVALLEEAGGPC